MSSELPCTGDTCALDQALEIIRGAPHSASALTLYALVSTLEFDQAGCLFKLTKLRDLDEQTRPLAYRLMELMVDGGNRGERWRSLKQAMDEAVRRG